MATATPVAVVVAVAGAGCPVVAENVAWALADPPATDEVLDFFFFFCGAGYIIAWLAKSQCKIGLRDSHIMPSPNRLKALNNRNILPQIRKQPKARLQHKVRDTEQNNPEDGHREEQSQEDQEPPAEVVNTLPQLDRPKRVARHGKDEQQRQRGIHLAHDLAALPKPHVIHIVPGFLLGLDLDGPQALDALSLLGGGRVVVAFVRVRLVHAEGEHRHGEELEGVFQRGAVGDFGKGGVLLAGFGVFGGLQGSEGTFN